MPAVGITDGPSPSAPDHQAVVSCSHLARRWAVLEHRSVSSGTLNLAQPSQPANSCSWFHVFCCRKLSYEVLLTHVRVCAAVVVASFSIPIRTWQSITARPKSSTTLTQTDLWLVSLRAWSPVADFHSSPFRLSMRLCLKNSCPGKDSVLPKLNRRYFMHFHCYNICA